MSWTYTNLTTQHHGRTWKHAFGVTQWMPCGTPSPCDNHHPG